MVKDDSPNSRKGNNPDDPGESGKGYIDLNDDRQPEKVTQWRDRKGRYSAPPERDR